MLKTIPIAELEPGMYVQAIVEQTGDMKIKSQGRVTSQAVVSRLKQQGIVKLAIDPSKAFQPDPEPELAPEESKPDTPKASFGMEIIRAKKLHDQGKALQNKLMKSVQKGLPMDIEIPREFSEQLVGSIDRNPNALMCLTKIREKDSYLLEHSLNVAILLANFGKHLNLEEEVVLDLAYAGFLHDVGKIKIPDDILHKPGRLSDQEMVVMRDHVYFGICTLESADIPEHIIRTVGEHHERIDGYGYPDGLRGDEISLFGRMIAIADTYDAITADRCYKPGMPSQKALSILMKDAPEKFDKALVEQFVKCVGIYPVGSLVKLSNEQVAMVTKQRDEQPLKPNIKIFYSLRGNHYLPPKDVDLSKEGIQFSIDKAVKPTELGIDFNRYFHESIAV